MPLFNIEYFRNSTRYGHSWSGLLIGAHTCRTQQCQQPREDEDAIYPLQFSSLLLKPCFQYLDAS